MQISKYLNIQLYTSTTLSAGSYTIKKVNQWIKTRITVSLHNCITDLGQSVVEIVIAVTLFAIVFTSGWQLIHNSYQQILENMNELRAHYYVIEGLEVVRGMRNENWNFLVVADETQSYHFELSNGLMLLNQGIVDLGSGFTREIYITSVRRDTDFQISTDPADDIDPDTKLVQIKVKWKFRGIEKTDQTSIYLTNWDKF